MSPEVARTEMVSLQVLVQRHRNIGSDAYQGWAASETTGIFLFQDWHGFGDFGWCGFLATGQNGPKKSMRNLHHFPEQHPHRSWGEPTPKSVPQDQKSAASSRPSSLFACLFQDCVLSSWAERPPGRVNNFLEAKKYGQASAPVQLPAISNL